jgi:hypothetical protein
MEIFKIYSADIFKKNLELINDKNINSDLKWKAIRENFTNHVTKTLPLLDKSKLVKIETLGYENYFFELWNNFFDSVDNQYKTGMRDLILSLTDSMVNYLILFAYSIDYKLSESEIQELIKKEISRFDFQLTFKSCRLSNTRLNLFLSPEGIFELKREEHKAIMLPDGKKTFETTRYPMEPNKYQIKIKTVDIEFKTGKLLINDWFRVEGDLFKNAVSSLKLDGCINYATGREAQIFNYAKNNVISVNIGNTCPSVYVKNGHLLVGRGPELKKGKTFKGNVCTDLWNATIIDEYEFVNKLKNNGASEADISEALRQVKDTWTTIQIKVEPGIYRVHFCADYEEFNKLYNQKDDKIDFGKKYYPYFLIEKL